MRTADLCDAHPERAAVAHPGFRDYGRVKAFHGVIETVKTFEDNSLVRAALDTRGDGKVLVVDGGGSMRCALFGDQLAALAHTNGWSGVIINGCIRDAVAISTTDIGVKALTTHPRKSLKRNYGDHNVPVQFAGVTFKPGAYVYADEDGIVVSDEDLLNS